MVFVQCWVPRFYGLCSHTFQSVNEGAIRVLQHENLGVQSRFSIGNEPHLGTDRYRPHSSSLTGQTTDMSPIRADEGECIATAKDECGVVDKV